MNHYHYPYGTPPREKRPRGPLAPDLTRSTTFALEDALQVRELGADRLPGEFYPRYGHPAGRLFEARVAELEGADGAVAFASGMAAFHALFCGLLTQGDVLLCSEQVYGGIHALLAEDLPRFGILVRRFDPFEPESLQRQLDDRVRLVHIETPVNPTCRIVDVELVARTVHAAGAWLSVDGTFQPPPLQRPLRHGADLVVHSATKLLGGHSDALGGVVSGRHEILGPLEKFRRRTGGVLAPDTAWLFCRSLSTLELRARAQAETASGLAAWLEQQRKAGRIRRVLYPGLPGSPDRELARRQMETWGSLLAFVLEDLESAMRIYDRFQTIARAVSLGGVETISSIPVHTSHASASPNQLESAGIEPGMIRISVGLEPLDELIEDLDSALG